MIMSIPAHHKRQEVCSSRAPYREGRKPKAVKVYTVNQESKYLLVQGVPAVGATQELIKLFAIHGAITEYRILDDYPAEHFTEVYLVKFEKIQAARAAKRKLDDWSFYGGVLHVCYAPEYETLQETREKLQDRRKAIAAKVRQYEHDGTYSSPYTPKTQTASSQHQQASSHNQKQSNKWSGSSMATETPVNKPVQELNTDFGHQHRPQQSASASDHFNNPGLSGTNIYGTQFYQYPPETHNSSSFMPNRRIMESHVQNRAMTHTPPPTKPSDIPLASVDQLKYPGQTHDEKTVTGSADTQELQLKLPLPPKPLLPHRMSRHNMSHHNQRLQNYNFAHVPPAQAEFPVDYDARLGPYGDKIIVESTKDKETEEFSIGFENSKLNEIDFVGQNAKNKVEKDKSMQEKIEENLKKKSDIVIKKVDSNRPAPKFIPRQAQIKKTSSVSSQKESNNIKSQENELMNRELKRNAFTLGKPQGPTVPGSDLVKQEEKAEESVNKTVKEIRKRMIEITDNKEPPTKSKKTA